MRFFSWLVGVGVLGILSGCPGTAGKLINERSADLSFVTADDYIYVDVANGLMLARVDGHLNEPVFSGDYNVQAIAPDRSIWVLSDSNTNLFLMYGSGGAIKRISELDGRASGVAISPDGKRVAASRHADFSLPQSQWVDDDQVYVIDVASRAVTVFEAQKPEWLMRLSWSKDGSKIYGESRETSYEIDPDSGVRTAISKVPYDDAYEMFSTPTVCEKDGQSLLPNGDLGLDIERNGEQKRLVRIEGKTRGFHDYHEIIPTYFFTKSCEFVVFQFEATVWVVEVATGLVSPLLRGRNPRILPKHAE